MRSIRYLNSILTVLAVLLTLQLWTSWTSSGPAVDGAAPALAAGIPNAGAQRKQMVDLLKRVVQQNEQMIEMFQSGQARVRVESRSKE